MMGEYNKRYIQANESTEKQDDVNESTEKLDEDQAISSLSGLNEANESTEKHVGDVEESPRNWMMRKNLLKKTG